MNGYDNETQDMAHQATSEAVSILVAEMEKDAYCVELALNEADCDRTDELMALRVKAHMASEATSLDAWADLKNFESARIAEYLLKYAKAEIEGAYYTRRSQTADLFANRLSRDEE